MQFFSRFSLTKICRHDPLHILFCLPTILLAAIIGLVSSGHHQTMGSKPPSLSVEEKTTKIMLLLRAEDSVAKLKAIAGDTPLTELKDSEGNSLLRFAAESNRVKVCEFLLDSKLDINVASQVATIPFRHFVVLLMHSINDAFHY